MKQLIAILGLILLFVSACNTNQAGTVPTNQPIKIGASLPLTGEAASYGISGKAGIDLAVKEINDAGGINGRLLQIIYEDDKCSSAGISTFTKLVQVDIVDAIVGPVCSAAAAPGLPVAQQGKTPVILLTASAPHLTKIGDYIFRDYPSDAFAGKFFAEYVTNTMKKQRVAIVYVKNDWGQAIHDIFAGRMKELGVTIVFDDSMNQEEHDARTLVTKLKEANPDVVVIPLYPASGLVFIQALKEQGIHIPILGGDTFDGDEVVKVPIADGTQYVIGKINNPDDFKARVKQASGVDTNIAAPLGYDAIKILALVMKQVGTNKQAVRDALAKISYPGISSPLIEFDENGDLKTAAYDVKTIKNGKSEIVKE